MAYSEGTAINYTDRLERLGNNLSAQCATHVQQVPGLYKVERWDVVMASACNPMGMTYSPNFAEVE
jgi:hypothetical protein